MAVTVTKLSSPKGTSKFPSLPLIIPNDTRYNPETNELLPIPGAKRDKVMIVQEALELLKSISKPVAVISIAGPYRSGKSYILSRLLGGTNTFDLGHTMNAKTFGIWMGTSVLEYKDHVVVLLDTEGIDAATSSGQEDTRIFVLTLLLSSFFIYNSKGVVHKSDLEKMKYFVKIASSVAVRKGSSKASVNELRKHFPDFLWLLRDVTLQPADEDGNEMSPKDYLTKRVLVQGDGFEESASDKVGRAIITFFPSIDCVTLPPPSDNVAIMREIHKNTNKLNPAFNKQVDHLIANLKKKITTKKVFESGEPVMGHLFGLLAKQFVEEVNDPNNTPALANTWESSIKILIADVQERLTQEYIEEFAKTLKDASYNDGPLEEGDSSGEGQSTMTTIFGIHHSLIIAKNDKLMNEVGRFCVAGATMGSGMTQEQLLRAFEKKILEVEKQMIEGEDGQQLAKNVVIGGALFPFVQENKKRSLKQCEEVFNRLYKPIKEKTHAPGTKYSFKDLRNDLKDLHTTYFLQATGPSKWEVYNRKQAVIETDQVVFERLSGYEKKIMEADRKLAESNSRSQKIAEDVNQLRQQLADEAAQHQRNVEQMGQQHAQVIERLEAEMQRREEVEERKRHEFIETQREMFAQQLESAEKRAQDNNAMMKGIMEQQKVQMDNMQKMIETMKRPPPPPPRRGICSIQ